MSVRKTKNKTAKKKTQAKKSSKKPLIKKAGKKSSTKKKTTKSPAKNKVTKKSAKKDATKTLYEQILERNNVKLTKRQKDIRDFIFRTFSSKPLTTHLKEYSEGSKLGLNNAAKTISNATNKFSEDEIAAELRKMRKLRASDSELYQICEKIFEKSSPFGVFDAALTSDPQCIINENRVVTILQEIRGKKEAEKHSQQLKNEINKTDGKLTHYEYRLVTGKYSEYFTKDEKKKALEAANRKQEEHFKEVEKNTKKIWGQSNCEPLTMDILNQRKAKTDKDLENNRKKILEQANIYSKSNAHENKKSVKSYTVESDPNWFENFDPKEEDKKTTTIEQKVNKLASANIFRADGTLYPDFVKTVKELASSVENKTGGKLDTGLFKPSMRNFEKRPPETVDPEDVQENMERMGLYPKQPSFPLKDEAEKAEKQLNQFEEELSKAVKEYLTAKRNFIVKKTVIEKAYKDVFGYNMDEILKFNI